MNGNIEILRNNLEKLIIKDADYKEIYEMSIKLDKLIVEYYRDIAKASGDSRCI